MTYQCTIPFEGFYDTKWSDLVDSEVTSYIEHVTEEEESEIPDCLKLSAIEMASEFWQYMDYSAAYDAIAKAYAESFMSEYRIPGKFKSMWSPKYYNFQTDQIDVTLPRAFVRDMWRAVKSERVTLARLVKSRHTSYSGFVSFYSDDVESWLKKKHTELDEIELSTVLLAWLELTGRDHKNAVENWSLYCRISEEFSGNGHYQDYVNWTKWDSDVKQKRLEVLTGMDEAELAELWDSSPWIRENLPEAEPETVSQFYRCPLTAELFETGCQAIAP